MKSCIKKADESLEYFFEEGCHILELSNTADDPGLSIARARVECGRRTRRHRLNGVTERYVILEGEGRMEVEGLPPQDVTVGDVVIIPPGVSQRITCIGGQGLVFLVLCTPRFTRNAYFDIENGSGSDEERGRHPATSSSEGVKSPPLSSL